MEDSPAFYLIDKLFSDDEKINLRLIPEACEKNNKKISGLNLAATKENFDSVLESIENKINGSNVFLCVAVSPSGGRLCIDVDDAPLPKWADKVASIICSRGKKNHHIWIKLKEPLTGVKFSNFVKKLLEKSGSKDKQSHDETRVIRLPGFPYRKTGKVQKGYEIVFMSDQIMTPKKIQSVIAGSKKDNTIIDEKLSFDLVNSAIEDEDFDHDAKRQQEISKYIHRVFDKKPIIEETAGRSRNLFFIGLDCHAWGLDLSIAVEIAKKINEDRHDPPEPFAVVEHQINSAYKYRKGPFGSRLLAAKGNIKKLRVEKSSHEHLVRARELLVDWAYIFNAEMMIDNLRGRELTTQSQINNYIAFSVGHAFSITTLLKEVAINVYDRADFRPDKLEVSWIESDISYVNLYVPYTRPEPVQNQDAVKKFLEHLEYMTNDKIEYDLLLNFFAFVTQFPGQKLKWAPLIISRFHGIGKNLFSILLEKIVGSHYVSLVNSDDLIDKNNDYIYKKLIVIADDVETGNRTAMKKLNPLITENKVRYVAKYARSFTTSNFAKFIFFSNKLGALKIDEYDRRIFAIVHEKDPKDQDYYTELVEHFEDNAGDIIEYLEKVNLSKFNPHQRPPASKSKKMLLQQSTTELDDYLIDLLNNEEGIFDKGYFQTKEVQEYIYYNAPETTKKFAYLKAIQEFLMKNSFRQYDLYVPLPSKDKKKRKHLRIWHRGGHDEFEKLAGSIRKQTLKEINERLKENDKNVFQ